MGADANLEAPASVQMLPGEDDRSVHFWGREDVTPRAQGAGRTLALSDHREV